MTLRTRNYVVITPVRNEAARLERTIAAVASQECVPALWVIVDDGSSDATPLIISAATASHSWIKSVRRADRGARKPGGGVVEAFYDGFALADGLDWEFLVKLDGDLSFEPDYFERCFAAFDADEGLGIAGGTVCVEQDGQLTVEAVGDPAFHVRGATKIYRRECWQAIEPLIVAPGWDTVDEVKANMLGWRTRTLHHVRLVQHKATGSADGSWRNWFKNGRGCYNSGYDPLFMFAKCVKRMSGTPLIVPGLALAAGYWSGNSRTRDFLIDRSVVDYFRREQRRRLLGRSSIYDTTLPTAGRDSRLPQEQQ